MVQAITCVNTEYDAVRYAQQGAALSEEAVKSAWACRVRWQGRRVGAAKRMGTLGDAAICSSGIRQWAWGRGSGAGSVHDVIQGCVGGGGAGMAGLARMGRLFSNMVGLPGDTQDGLQMTMSVHG